MTQSAQKLRNLLFGLILWPLGATAEPLTPPAAGSGEAYEAAVQWRRVATDMVYLDPNAPLPSLTSDVKAPVEEETGDDPAEISAGIVRVIVLAALAVFLFFLWRASRGQFVQFARMDDAKPTATGADAGSLLSHSASGPRSLDEIRADPDLQAGTVALLHLTLPLALERNDLRLHPSWTARDVLARISEQWNGRDDFATLVRAAEEAHFGNYPVSGMAFAASLSAAERILGTARPA